MEHSKQPQNGLGLLVLFLSLTLGGVVLSWIYIGLIDLIPFIYLNFLTALGFAIALGVIVKLVKTKFNISTVVGTVAIVILSLLIINFVRGQMWFAMWYSRMYFPDPDGYYFYFEPSFLNVFLDLRYFLDAIVWISRYPFENGANPIMVFVNDLRSFNYWGTWGMGYGLVTGFFLWIIWAVELAIICSMPLFAAAEPIGVKIADKGILARPDFLTYRFIPFTKDQLYRIESGDLGFIIDQPLVITGKSHQIALLFDGEIRTEYISLHKVPKVDKSGGNRFSMIAPVSNRAAVVARLTPEAIENLVKQLDEKYGATASFVSIIEEEENDTTEQ